MFPRPFHFIPRVTLLAAMVLLPVSGAAYAAEEPTDPAQLAPPTTGVYVQADDFDAWWQYVMDSPIGDLIDRRANEGPRVAWREIQAAMGMPGDQLMETYFGGKVAAIVRHKGPHQPAVIVTQIAKDDGVFLRERLMLVETGKAGVFTLYRTEDEKGAFGISDNWLAIADPNATEFMIEVLGREPGAASLADDATFKEWRKRLPGDAQALLYVRDDRMDEIHAVAAKRKGNQLDLTYAGKGAGWPDLLKRVGDGEQISFGPLPASALAAVGMNIAIEPKGEATEFINRMLMPKQLEKDVLPKLGNVSVFFIDRDAQGETGPDLPVIGLAVEMKDDAVAADLDTLMTRSLLMLNLATVKWQAPAINFSKQTHDSVSYGVADIGKLLAHRSQRAELESMQLVYGAADGWYVLTTSEAHFKQVLAVAAGDGGAAKIASPTKPDGQPIASLRLQPKQLAELAQAWKTTWQDNPPRFLGPPPHAGRRPEGRMDENGRGHGRPPRPRGADQMQRLQDAIDVLNGYKAVDLDLNTDGKGIVTGKIRLIAEEEGN